MYDQKQLWDSAHKDGELSHYSSQPTAFATEVLQIIEPNSRILELGCGVGNDSVGFAEAGHTVLATDFSEVAVGKNSESFKAVSNLSFQVLDMNDPFKFDDNEFDVVYARLSLHYFTDLTTGNIFTEIYRVLKSNGDLCFICKSDKDPLYGKGEEIEKDMYELDGHIRHFFSEAYTKALLDRSFEIVKMESGNEKFYGNDSTYIKVIACAVK